MVWLILDIFLASIIVVCLIFGIKNGFVAMALRLVSFFISAAIAGFVSGRLAPFLYERYLADKLVSFVSKNLGTITSTENAQSVLSSGEISKVFGLGNVNVQRIIEKIKYMAKIDSVELAKLIVDDTLRDTAVMFIRVIIFIIVFILVAIITALLIKLVKEVNELPVVGALNRVFGALFGMIEGALLCMVVCAVIGFILSLVTKGGTQIIDEACSQTILFNYLYNYNPLLKILSSI